MSGRERIYLCLAHMSENGAELNYIKDAFGSNWVAPLGPNVNGFESDLEKFVGEGKILVALSSGTAAIHLALLACGVGYGDEVIVQSFTFCASAYPVTYLGATPVFVDSEKDTWNLDPDLLEFSIQDRMAKTGKKPKAIIPVALYGMPYNIKRILEIANQYDIPVIEDAAEGFGSSYNGRMLGTFGNFGVFSFNGNKMITTSGGGALICPDKDVADKIKWLASQARESFPYYHHESIGYNYRLSNICAGIGRGQMLVAKDHISHHKHIQSMYEELLEGLEGVSVHTAPKGKDAYDSNYWLCTIIISPEVHIRGQEDVYKTKISGSIGGALGLTHANVSLTTDCQPNENVEALRLFLDAENVESRPLWKPMHKQPVFRGCPAYTNGVSESLFKVGLCLPSGPCVMDEDVKRVIELIKNAISM